MATDNVDYRLLDRTTDLVICSCCLRRGKVTPVVQVISGRHALTNTCPGCRHLASEQNGGHRRAAKLVTLRR